MGQLLFLTLLSLISSICGDAEIRSNLVTKGQQSVNNFARVFPLLEVESLNFEPIPGSPCLRPFGLFPIEGSCRKYVHCRLGVPFPGECALNTVFEIPAEACVHPDQSSRSECTAVEVHQFICPTYSIATSRLRFGDHDRLAHPSDCTKFFACLLNGQPRLASCPPPTAFEPASGFCKRYDLVKGCETIYDHLKEAKVLSSKKVVNEVSNPPKKSNIFFNFAQKL